MNFIKQKKDLDLNHIVDPSKDCIKYIKSSKEKKFTSHLYGDSTIRSDFKNYLISILFNTNNIEKTVSILKKFLEKTAHPEKIQFCIKIDNDDTTFVDSFLKEISKFEFNFIILSSPRGRGFIDLWQWINFLFKVSSKYSKFVMNISDEMYVNQKGWDNNLEKYISFEDDNIFRLRTSVYRNRNYHDLWECAYAPDTTAIYSRKYLSIQKNFSPCFGPDNGQQIVSYYLSKLNYPRHTQFLRDKVVNDITFMGQGTNIGLTKKQLVKRKNINHLLWLNIFTYKNQTNYFQRARKIQIEIIKNQLKKINHIEHNIKEYNNKYILTFYNKNNNSKNRLHLSKRISYLKLFFYNISRYDFFKYNTGYHQNKILSIIYTLYFLTTKKLLLKENDGKQDNTVLKSLIKFEDKLHYKFFYYDYKNIKLFIFLKKYTYRKREIKKNYFGWNIYTKIMNIFRLLIYILKNLFSFILFYLRLFIYITYWLLAAILFLIIFWEFLDFLRFQFGRYKLHFRQKSYLAYDDADQSKSLIIKGE